MASHVNTVDALSDSDLDAPTQELPGGVEDATPPKPTMPIPSPKTPAKPKRPASSSAAAAPRASKSDAGAAKKRPALKRPAASVAFGETYGGNIPDPKNKNEKKPRTAASLDSDGNPDLTMKYRFAPMQKKGSSAILRYDENGKKQVCQVAVKGATYDQNARACRVLLELLHDGKPESEVLVVRGSIIEEMRSCISEGRPIPDFDGAGP
ncbi:unnamed protein product [Cladocopium goreaui]|uniref:Uncharacterized protein n=1 Tax=Cladocopium goreaui TaxID=2562237 RepID=A0A9P1BX87_9DINO|nr:unnamed protein product [Cladocopium goreaui]